MKNFNRIFKCLLCSLVLLNTAAALYSKPSQSAALQPILVVIKGKTIELRTGMTKSDITAAIAGIITDEASVDTKEQLQYDIQLVKDEAPVTIVFYFNKNNMLCGLLLDSNTKEQNPPATSLVAWLNINAGKPAVKKKGKIIWNFRGWRIEHLDSGSGEDSMYRIEFTLQK